MIEQRAYAAGLFVLAIVMVCAIAVIVGNG